MRITMYKNYVDENQLNYLVKEFSINYTAISFIDNPSELYEIMKNVFHLHQLAEEEIYMICFNSKNVTTGFFLLGKGTVNSCPVSIRDIFIKAVLSAAVKFVICHNHPSQDITPSEDDIAITKKVTEAGLLMDIPLVDHIIICKDSYYSFAEHKLL